jgi:serralysin
MPTRKAIAIEWFSGSNFDDNLFGSNGDNRLMGLAGSDRLTGLNGNDFLDGGPGGDTMDGGAGNDILFGGAGADNIDGGTGYDELIFEGSTGVYVRLDTGLGQYGDAQGDVYRNIEAVYGSNFADTFYGDALSNYLVSKDGNDVIYAVGGNDTIDAGKGADFVDGGDGIDTISFASSAGGIFARLDTGTGQYNDAEGDRYYNIENISASNFSDTLQGNAAANRLMGLDGDDVIYGLAGNDFLEGGLGNDTLIGGTQADTFIFNTPLNATTNVDILSDFSVIDDVIHLNRTIFSVLPAGSLAASAFQIGAAANDVNDRIIYNATNGNLLYDSDGTGASAAILFAKLPTGLALTSTDFMIM